MQIIVQTFWLFLPAGAANVAPTLFKWIPLDHPISEKFFGKNKTYRGFIFGIFFSVLIVYIQKLLYSQMASFSSINYSTINIYLLGFLFGFGALFGDLVASFLKRKININPGKPWIPFDQIDWIIGAIIFGFFYINIPALQILIGLILFGILHPLINLLGYGLGVKNNRF